MSPEVQAAITKAIGDGSAIVCSIGCCPGCQRCYGMSIGCHQDPCRCDQPCVCRYADEDDDPGWRDSCLRHDGSEDQRNRYERDEPEYDPDNEPETWGRPCVICGATTACGNDDEGRPWIHVDDEEAEDA